MKEFSEYEKMPEQLKNLGLSEKAMSDLHKVKWVVTEKVHGANFSFIYEDKKLKFAKRKDYLQWTDDFFGFQLVVQRNEVKLLHLFEQLSLDFQATKYIVYGELFGGEYPHPSVTADLNLKAIQTGVYYSPVIEFYAFDIAIEQEGNEEKYYLDYETSLDYFEKHKLYHAKPLFNGKLNEAMLFNTRINSSIPTQLSLPPLEHNLIEGIVLKPLIHSAALGRTVRPILKIKNAEFNEQEKFHQAEKWFYIPSVSSNSEELGFILEELNHYITQNRFNSVISKTGNPDLQNPKRTQEIKDEFLLDVWTDFNLHHQNLLLELQKNQQEWIKDRLTGMIAAFLNY